jgi:hypothetical protein
LSQQHVSRTAFGSQTNLREETSGKIPNRREQKSSTTPAISSAANWDAETVLDAAYNRLQELMQLLYLLSRDPAVPNDARYHVTVAQSEIALLSRVMQNSASEPCANARAHHAL